MKKEKCVEIIREIYDQIDRELEKNINENKCGRDFDRLIAQRSALYAVLEVVLADEIESEKLKKSAALEITFSVLRGD